jgi:hypothetical protein
MKLPSHTDRFRAFWKICLWGVCVCVCVHTRAENLWQHALSHHLLIAAVLVGKTNCNYPWLLYSPDLALCNLLAFHETQHWVYRPLFCIHWRNATEHNSRSHIYSKRGLPEELSAMAGLLEHLCTYRRAVTVIVIRLGFCTWPLYYKLCFNSKNTSDPPACNTNFLLCFVLQIIFLCFILTFVPCIFIICIMNQQMHN